MAPPRVFGALVLSFTLVAPAVAHAPNDPPHQSFCMGELKLERGDAIRDFCISYVTHGTLNANNDMVSAPGPRG